MKTLNILIPEDKAMTKQNATKKLKRWNCVYLVILIVGALALLLSGAVFSRFFSFKSFLGAESFYSHLNPDGINGNQNKGIGTVQVVVQRIQKELDKLRETEQDPSSSSHSVVEQGAFLADI